MTQTKHQIRLTVEEGSPAEKALRVSFWSGIPIELSGLTRHVRMTSIEFEPRLDHTRPRYLTYCLEYEE